MSRLFTVLVLAGASLQAQTITQTFGSGANSFSIDFVEIGNPGNAATTTGTPPSSSTLVVGSVNYTYKIGKYEISRQMIDKANLEGGLGITLADMSAYGGNGSNKPATGVSWNEAARFVNWLNDINGFQKAYNFQTVGANDEVSSWSVGQYSGSNQYRHKNAVFVIPTADEWYKAGYGGPDGVWYKFTTGSDIQPISISSGTASGTVVINRSENLGPSDITNAGGLSAFGTMAQGGNVWEWSETLQYGNRMFRGASWQDPFSALDAQLTNPPSAEYDRIGFRVAMIPEPSPGSLLLAGGALLMAGRRTK